MNNHSVKKLMGEGILNRIFSVNFGLNSSFKPFLRKKNHSNGRSTWGQFSGFFFSHQADGIVRGCIYNIVEKKKTHVDSGEAARIPRQSWRLKVILFPGTRIKWIFSNVALKIHKFNFFFFSSVCIELFSIIINARSRMKCDIPISWIYSNFIPRKK